MSIRAHRRCPLRSASGQALVEFAIAIPVIMLVVLGIIDFGRAYNYKNDETSLANQALRYAEVNKCVPCGGQPIEDYVKSNADSPELESGGSGLGIQTPGVTISFCTPSGTGAVGDPLQAKATATYRWLPYLNIGDVTITSTAIGRIENPYNSGGSNAYATGSPSSPILTSC